MDNKEKINIWGDVVSIKDLLLSIFITLVTTMGLYFYAKAFQPSYVLFFGLGGAVIGFIISSFIFSPKRVVEAE
ncbi:hypothetical protein ACWOAQ_01000 [Helcococcus kunzii]|uniref:Uncharacterized protein n=1 Tax=Helcococcus kunzii ATCC 51366 TaxID=883114 RepID=H3NP08_9FIRM|nr:hypothetical protein [Helcococcus kunzii]EHR34133.1 hypothetical protein HMPREF9709_01069 [Helcococcus kunzii ATCC 51366]MCT1795740.1 hypothetical protein [Helcococcus kunzii]MCT1989579.1 hypothetical protein [Helcococcus kunzii]